MDDIEKLAKEFYPEGMGGLNESAINRYRAGYLAGYKAAQSKPAEIIPFKEGYDEVEKFFSNRLGTFQIGYSVVDIVNRLKEKYDLIPK